MQIDALSLVLRPRSMWEGCDLGVRLLQERMRSVYRCHLAVALPLFLVCYATVGIASWLPALLIWMSKPWLDRTILFALARALFGQETRTTDLWAARREVWGGQFLVTVTLLRLSASRSFSQPIRQLEGLAGAGRRARLRQLATRHRGIARMLTQVFAVAEFALFMSLMSLSTWLGTSPAGFKWDDLLWRPAGAQVLATTVAYAAAVAFLEPYYVAAGFGLYLNRRVELEAWDIEQEFRRAF